MREAQAVLVYNLESAAFHLFMLVAAVPETTHQVPQTTVQVVLELVAAVAAGELVRHKLEQQTLVVVGVAPEVQHKVAVLADRVLS